jgi:lysozyme
LDIERLKKEIISDEGVVFEIYLDHLGFKTFGVGHLVNKNDPEFNLRQGIPISKKRVDDCFSTDIQICVLECSSLYREFQSFPEEVQLIIANMMFNLGQTRLAKFKDMKKALDNQDYKAAAAAMVDSRWYNQVPNRAKRLVERMKNVSDT